MYRLCLPRPDSFDDKFSPCPQSRTPLDQNTVKHSQQISFDFYSLNTEPDLALVPSIHHLKKLKYSDNIIMTQGFFTLKLILWWVDDLITWCYFPNPYHLCRYLVMCCATEWINESCRAMVLRIDIPLAQRVVRSLNRWPD